jgi:ABC-type phosphate/phosphonate transport system permease subunit
VDGPGLGGLWVTVYATVLGTLLAAAIAFVLELSAVLSAG